MKETPFDFDKHFDSEEEAIAAVDGVMMKIANDISKDESGTSVVIPERVKQVETAYKVMQLITNGKNVDITYELNTPYTSMGSVSVVGKEIVISNPSLFVKVAGMASNLEVFTKTNGMVQMNFTFHNLTRKVGD